jgi:hypothetical protein
VLQAEPGAREPDLEPHVRAGRRRARHLQLAPEPA